MLLEMELWSVYNCPESQIQQLSKNKSRTPLNLYLFYYLIFLLDQVFFLMFYRKEHHISQTEQYRKIQLYSRDSRWSFIQFWYMKRYRLNLLKDPSQSSPLTYFMHRPNSCTHVEQVTFLTGKQRSESAKRNRTVQFQQIRTFPTWML